MRVIAGTNSGTFISPDGGATWAPQPGNDFIVNIVQSTVRPSGPAHYLYACGSSQTSIGVIYRSSDGGATWTPLPSPSGAQQQFAMATSKLFPDTLYLMGYTDQKIYKSTNAGAVWMDSTHNFPAGGVFVGAAYDWGQYAYNNYVATSAKAGQDVVYVGRIDLVKSVNGGASWASIGGATYDIVNARTHNDQHACFVNPANPNDVLFGNDGGAYRYTESTDTFQNLNATLSITQFYSGDWDDTGTLLAIGGAQDNATPWLSGGVWHNSAGGDGGGSVIDPLNHAVMFATQNKAITKTDTTGVFSGDINMPWMANEHRRNACPLAIDPNNHAKVYAMGQYVYRIDNVFGGGATRLNGPNEPNVLTFLQVATGDSNTMYAAGAAALYVTRTGGNAWTNIAANLPNAFIFGVSISSTNKNDVIAVTGGIGVSHVWRCLNTAAASPVWIDISGTTNPVPDVNANCVTRDPFAPLTFYVGTDIGVFVTVNGGVSWFNATNPLGLPNCPVMAMKALPSSKFLYIATYSRGMWRLPLSASTPPTVTSLSFVASSFNVGQTLPGTVHLSAAMPFPGDNVNLSSSSPAISILPTAFVSSGSLTAPISVIAGTATTSTTATITASYRASSATTTVTVNLTYPQIISFVPNWVFGGYAIPGRLMLSGPPYTAGTATMTINSQYASTPQTLKVPALASYVDFWVSTVPIAADQTIPVSVSFNGKSRTDYFTLYTAQVSALTPNTSKYASSSKGSLLVNLTSKAGPGGKLVKFTVAPSNVISMPTSLAIPNGSVLGSVGFSTLQPSVATNVTITATAGRDAKSTTITVNP